MPTNAELAAQLEEVKREMEALRAVPQVSTADLSIQIAGLTQTTAALNEFAMSLQIPRSVAAVPIEFNLIYDGRNDSHAASDWLSAWKSNIELQGFEGIPALELARRTLTRSAATWFSRIYSTVRTVRAFEEQFRSAFMPQVDSIELGARMIARIQNPGEDVMEYIHDKLRLLAPLKKNIDTQKRYVAKGCRWPAMVSHLTNAIIADEGDLINTARIFVEDTQYSQKPAPKPSPSQPYRKPYVATTVPTVPTVSKTATVPKSEPRSNPNPVVCYNCFGQGHMVRECPEPKRVPFCTSCRQSGHVRSKCPQNATASAANSATSSATLVAVDNAPSRKAIMSFAPVEISVVKYNRDVKLGETIVSAQIDPGSVDCLIRATNAIEGGLTYQPTSKRFSGIGPGPSALGVSNVPITIDDITLEVPVYIVPDASLPVPLLIGRTWTEDPSVLFVRIRDQFKFLRHDEFAIKQLAAMFDEPECSVLRTREPISVGPSPLSVGCAVEAEWDQETCMLVADNSATVIVVNEEKPTIPLYTKGKSFQLPANTIIGHVLKIDQALRDALPSSKPSDELWRPFTLAEVPMGPDLTSAQQFEILEVINTRRHAFATSIRELGCTDLVSMEIDEFPSSTPTAQRPYRSSIESARILETEIETWCEAKICEASTSPYAAPSLLVDKKDGKKRPVFDYRKLNAQTIPIPFPMPNLDDQLSELSEAEWYIVLDMFSGYLQLRMHPKSVHKTAFVTQFGHYQFLRMPFGLKNGPAVFQRLMNLILRKFRRYVFCYLDDIIIIASSFAELISRLIEVLNALLAANLTCRIDKCVFGTKRIEFLGFVIDHGMLKPGERKTVAIANFPRPRDAREIRRFLGLTGFFRRFIVKYALIASPLTDLTKKDAVFDWALPQQSAFEQLKEKLVTEPILKLFDRNKPIEVHTDASATGVGGMLMQRHDGKLHLVYAVSKRCTKSESLYHSSRLELLAIVWTLGRLRSFLLGNKFVVVTDCQCLTYLHKAKATNGQLARWAILLSEFDVEFKHRAGTMMAHVDAISRAPYTENPDSSIEEEILDNSPALVLVVDQYDEIRTFQAEDPEIRKIIRYVGTNGNKDPEYEVKNGLLYRKSSEKSIFVLPKSMRKAICIKYHDQLGHYSLEKVVASISSRYWFSGMRQYVKNHIRRCFACLTAKGQSGKQAGYLYSIAPAEVPFVTVHIDHLGPLVTSKKGYQHIFVIVDSCTRYVELYPTDSTTAEEVVQSFASFVLRFGYPRHIVSDRGTAFTATAFQTWCTNYKIRHTLVSTRHPRGNGLVERVNRVIVPQIVIYSKKEDNSDWHEHLPLIQRNINASINRSLDKSPFEMLYGFKPNFVDSELALIQPEPTRREPNEIREEARVNIVKAQAQNKRYFDRRHCPGETLEVGQIVFALDAPGRKLDSKFRGPLVVVKQIAPDTYRCQTLNTEGLVLRG